MKAKKDAVSQKGLDFTSRANICSGKGSKTSRKENSNVLLLMEIVRNLGENHDVYRR